MYYSQNIQSPPPLGNLEYQLLSILRIHIDPNDLPGCGITILRALAAARGNHLPPRLVDAAQAIATTPNRSEAAQIFCASEKDLYEKTRDLLDLTGLYDAEIRDQGGLRYFFATLQILAYRVP